MNTFLKIAALLVGAAAINRALELWERKIQADIRNAPDPFDHEMARQARSTSSDQLEKAAERLDDLAWKTGQTNQTLQSIEKLLKEQNEAFPVAFESLREEILDVVTTPSTAPATVKEQVMASVEKEVDKELGLASATLEKVITQGMEILHQAVSNGTLPTEEEQKAISEATAAVVKLVQDPTPS